MEKVSQEMEKNILNKRKLSSKQLGAELLSTAGVTLNGDAPGDIRVNNPNLYSRVLKDGALGLGESYMEKWWDCDRLDIFFEKVLRAQLDVKINMPLRFYLLRWIGKHFNLQTKLRALKVAKKHYDLGNTLFENMLDQRLIYSCAYWKGADTLDAAQEAKLDLICQKLKLQPGLKLLDIGCGWGGLAKFAVENYGVEVVGITISKQQAAYAKDACAHLPIEIRLQDYRDINETFDRIVSVGMFEHVGQMNYQVFMQTVQHALKDDGLFLLHTIGLNETCLLSNEWITKYIFPNGQLPSAHQIAKAAEKLFVMEDWHSFGNYYDNTLMAWYDNFKKHWDNLKHLYDERFYRMWSYYLLSCAGSFRSRTMQLWQIVFSKTGLEGGYQSVR